VLFFDKRHFVRYVIAAIFGACIGCLLLAIATIYPDGQDSKLSTLSQWPKEHVWICKPSDPNGLLDRAIALRIFEKLLDESLIWLFIPSSISCVFVWMSDRGKASPVYWALSKTMLASLGLAVLAFLFGIVSEFWLLRTTVQLPESTRSTLLEYLTAGTYASWYLCSSGLIFWIASVIFLVLVYLRRRASRS